MSGAEANMATSSIDGPATIATLPWGPLENAILFLREYDLAQLLQVCKDLSTVDSEAFWRERCCDAFGRHLSCIQNLNKTALGALLAAERYAKRDESKRVGQPLPACRTSQLLVRCRGASSQDHPSERPGLTLSVSPCGEELRRITGMRGAAPPLGANLGQRCQMLCGCNQDGKCYWSSAPSAVSDKNEWIEYDMAPGLAVLTTMLITPYTSFWQPLHPTYNPVEVYMELSHPEIKKGEPYYKSPRFRIQGCMEPQRFPLPQPILSLGGRAKLYLLGMSQRQTLGAEAGATANHYHICLSHVALQGAQIRSLWLDAAGDADEGGKARSGFTHVFRPLVNARFAFVNGRNVPRGFPWTVGESQRSTRRLW